MSRSPGRSSPARIAPRSDDTSWSRTGLGFALVASPFLVLLVGPVAGVTLGNVLAIALATAVLTRTWRDTRWRRTGLLLGTAFVGTAAGALLLTAVPTRALFVLVGSLAVAAIGIVLAGPSPRLLAGVRGGAVSGALSGFMNTTAGVGGPAIAMHSIADRWPAPVFVGTAQAYFLGVNTMSLAFKGFPRLPVAVWVGALATLALGIAAGQLLHRHVPASLARRAVVAIALTGGLATITRGLLM
ncbi:TSUP family transporter [Phytohabitans kaempferiae]|uniref:Probable membrane transporter protein n=1 Tax=Phytohabitans kaempferiae TaxID=1620943 RepID=A0ABV6MHA8_9ACTN